MKSFVRIAAALFACSGTAASAAESTSFTFMRFRFELPAGANVERGPDGTRSYIYRTADFFDFKCENQSVEDFADAQKKIKAKSDAENNGYKTEIVATKQGVVYALTKFPNPNVVMFKAIVPAKANGACDSILVTAGLSAAWAIPVLTNIIGSLNDGPVHDEKNPDDPSRGKFFPIELVCPATEPNGTLDLISERTDGSRNRLRVVYANYNPKMVQVAVASSGQTLHETLSLDLDAKNNPVDRDYANDLVVKSNALKTNVCEGSASNRQRYLAALAKNKSIFINAARDRAPE